MTTRRSITYILLLLAVSLIAGCAAGSSAVYEKDGRKYGVVKGSFRDKWWNYYERGCSYQDGGYYAEACADFGRAVSMREEDSRRARTYGMHFTEYFPHRELGVTLLAMGRSDEAIKELETSLSQQDSAKAKFYLNKARKAVIERRGLALPVPTISLGSLPTLTNRPEAVVSGKAASDGYVSSISIGGRPVSIELSAREMPFESRVQLIDGENRLDITATDLAGGRVTKTVVINLDRRGPVVDIDSPDGSSPAPGQLVAVSGGAFDPSGIASVSINGEPFAFSPGDDARFSRQITVPSSGVIEITATDVAGNTTTASIGSDSDDTATASNGISTSGTLYASLDATYIAKASSSAVITLKDMADSQDVYYDSVYIEGRVSSTADIVSLIINGEPTPLKKGKRIFFNAIMPLIDGENRCAIRVSDASGGTAEKSALVRRLPQKARSKISRYTVSALPFLSDDKDQDAEFGYDSFIGALVDQKRFNVVERKRIEDLMQEQALSQEAIVDQKTAARLGKIISAEGMLMTTVHKKDNAVEIYSVLVDTETSEITASMDVYGEDSSLIGVKTLMEGLALKFKNGFPLVEGMVIKADGGIITIDRGSGAGIRPNEYIMVFKEGEHVIHPVTKKDLGAPTVQLGRAKITEVYDDMAMAEMVNVEGKAGIDTTDLFITK